jgi:pSer/pThr/pTyr-binding forkhead associated (FHA) protein
MLKNTCRYCHHDNRLINLFCTKCGAKLTKEITSQPRLIMIQGDRQNAVFNLSGTQNTIGRSSACSISLNDAQISKQHALVLYHENDYWIEDTNSKNGIFVNGAKVQSQKRLFHGCIIRLGSTVLRFETFIII